MIFVLFIFPFLSSGVPRDTNSIQAAWALIVAAHLYNKNQRPFVQTIIQDFLGPLRYNWQFQSQTPSKVPSDPHQASFPLTLRTTQPGAAGSQGSG
jgi:hypothetical protein